MERTIKTPRGTFYLVLIGQLKQLKKDGYGYHHEHNGFVVLSNGKSAVAVKKEDFKKMEE